ncbi:hypothetical protein [Exiguobacterium sp. s78]|uniref:hypothetical protein n=1 Tax=Exiguobacterium sp. s78 TaxID=2751197 RepID=UPI001BE7B174|nr:hypothetical protein [Exiguobacterium sp. s78]
MPNTIGLAAEEDKLLFWLGNDEVKQLHTLLNTRPLGFLEEFRKEIEKAYDDINSKASQKGQEA